MDYRAFTPNGIKYIRFLILWYLQKSDIQAQKHQAIPFFN
jgi:hypothetical protein